MRLVCIADTHKKHIDLEVPDGDVLIHAGDIGLENRKHQKMLWDFHMWIESLPHEHKIVIAGNHDWYISDNLYISQKILHDSCNFLSDSEVIIDGVKFYGSPWQPDFGRWAFNLPRGSPLLKKWLMIPDDTDVLITHGPPRDVLDRVYYSNQHVGCDDLWDRIVFIRPKVHVFGHIHEGYGMDRLTCPSTIFVNASVVNEFYQLVNKPIVIDI